MSKLSPRTLVVLHNYDLATRISKSLASITHRTIVLARPGRPGAKGTGYRLELQTDVSPVELKTLRTLVRAMVKLAYISMDEHGITSTAAATVANAATQERIADSKLLTGKELRHQLANMCACEMGGWHKSGLPGVLGHVEPGRLPDRKLVERCDICKRYPDDDAAYAALVRHLAEQPPAVLLEEALATNPTAAANEQSWADALDKPETHAPDGERINS